MKFITSTKDSKKFRKGSEATTKTVFTLETEIGIPITLKNAGYTENEVNDFTWYGFAVSVLQKGRDGNLSEVKNDLIRRGFKIDVEENVPVERHDVVSADDKEKLSLLKNLSTAQIKLLLDTL